jgi:serine/threonine-protein kinase HipA
MIGAKALPVGQLTFVRDGRREYSGFSYTSEWLRSHENFAISPDLPLREGFVTRRAPSDFDSPFPFALADTAPDAWGARVIKRAHAKRRAEDPTLAPLTAFDYLSSVDDFSRVGALRLVDAKGQFLGSGARYRTPKLVDLGKIVEAARKVEAGTDSMADLQYLQGKATSLGGMRPKCTVLEENGSLAIGKFPSITDERSIVRAEVLALRLVAHAGAQEAEATAGGIATKLAQWREIAKSRDVGLSEAELANLAPAFEHEDARAARALAP